MIAKFIKIDEKNNLRTNIYEVDEVLSEIVMHPHSCTCEACSQINKDEYHIHTTEGREELDIPIKTITCYKIKETEPMPDKQDWAVLTVLAAEVLGPKDVCYLMNDQGKTIETIR